MFKEIIKYSDNQYDKKNKFCTNEQQNCYRSCIQPKLYLEKGDYKECPNMVYYYFCKYGYKFVSEIYYLLDYIDKENLRLNDLPTYNVLSLGCGPCTELFGLLEYIDRKNLNKKINYLGIDKLKSWVNIHELVDKKLSEINFDIFNIDLNDFLEFYKSNIKKSILNEKEGMWTPNILFLNYLISDLERENNTKDLSKIYEELFDKIIKNMYKQNKSYIIINDINVENQSKNRLVYSAIKNFVYILEKELGKSNIKKKEMYFSNNNLRSIKNCYEYSFNDVLFNLNDPDFTFENNYEMHDKCTSYQCVISLEN